VEGLLRDHAGAHRREIAVLLAAADEGIPRDLLEPPPGVPASVSQSRLVQRLEDQRAISPEAARWAVAAWSEALGIAAPEPGPAGGASGLFRSRTAPAVPAPSTEPLHDAPRRALAEIIARHGPELSTDVRRVEGLLRDHAGAHRREIAVLMAAAEERIPRDLLATEPGLPLEMGRSRLVQRLEEQRAINPEAARWAVAAWAEALGISEPEPVPAEVPQPEPPRIPAEPVRSSRLEMEQAETAQSENRATGKRPLWIVAALVGLLILAVPVVLLTTSLRGNGSPSGPGNSPTSLPTQVVAVAPTAIATSPATEVPAVVATEVPAPEATPVPTTVVLVPPASARAPATAVPAGDLIEIVGHRLGTNPYLDVSTDLVRIGTDTDVFQVSDIINAIVYVRAKAPGAKERTYTVTHRWTVPNASQPFVFTGELAQFPRDRDQVYSRACAPAIRIDAQGSGNPVKLEVLIDDRVVADFQFRVSGGNAQNVAPPSASECSDQTLPRSVFAIDQTHLLRI
jgi:hypothetical protein